MNGSITILPLDLPKSTAPALYQEAQQHLAVLLGRARAAGDTASEFAIVGLLNSLAQRAPARGICLIGPPAGEAFSPEAAADLQAQAARFEEENNLRLIVCSSHEDVAQVIDQLREVADGFTSPVIELGSDPLSTPIVTPDLSAIEAFAHDTANRHSRAEETEIASLLASLNHGVTLGAINRATRRRIQQNERREAKRDRKASRASRKRNRR